LEKNGFVQEGLLKTILWGSVLDAAVYGLLQGTLNT
jgi:hypothetical protein